MGTSHSIKQTYLAEYDNIKEVIPVKSKPSDFALPMAPPPPQPEYQPDRSILHQHSAIHELNVKLYSTQSLTDQLCIQIISTNHPQLFAMPCAGL